MQISRGSNHLKFKTLSLNVRGIRTFEKKSIFNWLTNKIQTRKSFDFKLKSVRSDEEGRYFILETTIQDVPFLLVNIYAPNSTSKQSLFFRTLSELIYDEGYSESDYKIILGGDSVNITMDPT